MKKKDIYRLAAVNWELRPAKRFQEFVQHLKYIVNQAALNSVDILVLPEYFSLEILAAAKDCSEEQMPMLLSQYFPKIKRVLRELAVHYSITIVGGSSFRRHRGLVLNSSITAFSDGSFLIYDKQNLVAYEKDVWSLSANQMCGNMFSGNDFSVQICFDIEFPEISRAQVFSGSPILCVPSYTHSLHGFNRVRWSCHARSVEYQCFVAQACLVGEMPELDLVGYGKAAILSPPVEPLPGEGILMETALNKEGLAYADVNIKDLDFARKYGEVRNWAINMNAPANEPAYVREIQMISAANRDLALRLGELCFEQQEDRLALSTIVSNYAAGQHKYESPFTRRTVNLLPHSMITKNSECLAICGLYFYEDQPQDAWLSWLAVTPEQQRHGLGTSFVKSMMKIASGCGMKKISVLASQSDVANAFYLSNGFKKEGSTIFLGKKLPVYTIGLS